MNLVFAAFNWHEIQLHGHSGGTAPICRPYTCTAMLFVLVCDILNSIHVYPEDFISFGDIKETLHAHPLIA